MTRDRVSAILLFLLSAGYGWASTSIQTFAGAEGDPFTAQTLPRILAALGMLLALGIYFGPTAGNGAKSLASAFSGLDWPRALALLVLMGLFAEAIEWLGFVVASAIFLAAGFRVLGLRRVRTLVLGSVPLAVGFWLILAKVLGIYLAPGELWIRLGLAS